MKRVMRVILCAALCGLLSLGLCACKTVDFDGNVDPIAPAVSNTDTTPQENAEPVIIDNEYVKQTVITGGFDSYGDYVLGTTVENKSDRTLSVEWDACMVNGWTVGCWEWEEILPGDTIILEVTLYEEDLERAGVTSVDEIAFHIVASDAEDWLSEELMDEICFYYPEGKSADEIKYVERVPQEGEMTVVDENGFTFIVESIDPDGMRGYTLNCYFANSTDEVISYSAGELAVDRWMMESYDSSENLLPGSGYRDAIFFDAEKLELCGITEPTEIVTQVTVYETVSYDEIFSGSYAIYPTGLTADDVVVSERESIPGEVVVLDNEYVTLVIVDYEYDDTWGYVFGCYLENKSDMALSVEVDEISVEGQINDMIWWQSLKPGTRGYFAMDTVTVDGAHNADEFEFRVSVEEEGSYDELLLERVEYNP